MLLHTGPLHGHETVDGWLREDRNVQGGEQFQDLQRAKVLFVNSLHPSFSLTQCSSPRLV